MEAVRGRDSMRSREIANRERIYIEYSNNVDNEISIHPKNNQYSRDL
jgi:hypothetical protein